MKIFFCIVIGMLTFTACDVARQVINESGSSGNLTTQEIVSGLKQALTIGAQNSSDKLSAVDGFFANAAIKILMPPETKNVESNLRNLGLSSLVNKAIL